jgi:hypothetical protein
MYVWSHDEKWQQSASAVADALGMDRGTVGKALAELQERGWFVREIHQTIIGEKGKPRTAWERWHVQMTNRRFTSDEIQELMALSDVRVRPARSTDFETTCGRHQHERAGGISMVRADGTSTIEMDCRNAPEVHSSNGSTEHVETDPFGRSRSDEGRTQAPNDGAEYRSAGLSGHGCRLNPFCENPSTCNCEPRGGT